MAVNKGKVATQIEAALLEPTLNMAGEKVKEWFEKQDPVTRTADLLGNIGSTTRTRILGALTDEVNAPSVNIADYKRAAYEASPHEYGGMSKQTRAAKEFGDEAYFRNQQTDKYEEYPHPHFHGGPYYWTTSDYFSTLDTSFLYQQVDWQVYCGELLIGTNNPNFYSFFWKVFVINQ